MMQESSPLDFSPIAELRPSIADAEYSNAGQYLSGLDENQELIVLAQVGRRLSQVKALGFLGSKDVRAHLIEIADSHGIVERHSIETVNNVLTGAINAGLANPTEGQSKRSQDGPIPLIAELGEPAPFPIDALGQDLASAAEAIASKVQTSRPIAAQSVLAAASLVAQPHADIQMPFGQSRPLSLFLITIASSGDRKSSADNEALWPIRRREAALVNDYDQELPVWKIDVSAWSSEKKKIEADKKLTFDQRKASLERLGSEPLPPLLPMLTAPDPTIEGLVKAWPQAPASLGLFSAEGGQFVGGYGMGQDHKLKTAAALSELWDGRETRRLRAGDGLTTLRGRRLSTHIMLQPAAANAFLSDPVLRDQGLLSRALIAAPTSIAGSRLYRACKPEDQATIASYGANLLRLLERGWPLQERTRNELVPRVLSIGAAAEKVWREFHDHIEGQSGKHGELAVVRDFAGKAAEHAARIAGVLTILRDVDAVEVEVTEMSNATRLVDWYLGETLRLAAASMTSPAIAAAKRLLDWLHSRSASTVALRDIIRLGPAESRSKAAAEAGLKILVDHGWVTEGSLRPRLWNVVRTEG
ncbi:DUF3987 domain-containing protein [Bradyrhizobium sp. AUGA SZCCT0169]|uniref:YfjI family protein n=1 Tax=Bradyrhizobium sp. AUGA SZCCT0169 TaxID=2807663 RepID=UPI001BAA67EF|nr:YfjI family protein [Bradyrhizobium sp. AUGA SZCCT0169]MBR1249179.1 DUF3987 domain-containing protein [Bradyrhizobium sp. AUGA SZCCT0169]